MAEGKRSHDWAIASSQIATLINCHGGIKGRAVKPEEVNPTHPRAGSGRGIPMTGRNLTAIAAAMGAETRPVKAADVRVAP